MEHRLKESKIQATVVNFLGRLMGKIQKKQNYKHKHWRTNQDERNTEQYRE
jgi:hypothetical protein